MKYFSLDTVNKKIIINLKIFTNATHSGFGSATVVFKDTEYIKFFICSSPVDGKANQELILKLSKILKIKKQQIEIIAGKFDNYKKILIKCLDSDMINNVSSFLSAFFN